MHEVLVNCLFKLAQEKEWLGELALLAMTIAVDLGRKAAKQTNKQPPLRHLRSRRWRWAGWVILQQIQALFNERATSYYTILLQTKSIITTILQEDGNYIQLYWEGKVFILVPTRSLSPLLISRCMYYSAQKNKWCFLQFSSTFFILSKRHLYKEYFLQLFVKFQLLSIGPVHFVLRVVGW